MTAVPETEQNRDNGKKKKRMSVRWRLLISFGSFVIVLIAVLWVLETVFLTDIYRSIKKSEMLSSAEKIGRELENCSPDSEEIRDLVRTVSESCQMCIDILDEKGVSLLGGVQSVCYLRGETNRCLIHRTSGNLTLSLLRLKLLQTARQSGEAGFYVLKEATGEAPQWPEEQDGWHGLQGRTEDPGAISGQTGYVPGKNVSESGLLYVSYFPNAQRPCFLVMDTAVTPLDATKDTLRFELLLVSGVFILLAVLMAAFLSRTIARPIIEINDKAGQLATGAAPRFKSGEAYREVDELSDTLNHVSEELSKVDTLRRELIANVSHDLRTPLTMISGYAEVMRDIPDEKTPENIQVIIDESNRLSGLVNDLLELSKLQSGAISLNPSVFSLTECVRSILGRYQKLKENDGYTLLFVEDREAFIRADYSKIQQVIYNLVNNAVSYTGEDKTVTVTQTLVRTGGTEAVRISVSDTGEGIAKENLELIWDRYYRENKAHRRAVVGTGLGLSIVKNILQLHRAAFGVESDVSEDSHGSTFWFELNTVDPDRESEIG
ncbi:MAG: HAMP domain-containing histidine kinase [Clostridia bacterium]|nr:HAMP domain-containing histidine kinase [Clostridia bacterium]